jgi:hypothetical protein
MLRQFSSKQFAVITSITLCVGLDFIVSTRGDAQPPSTPAAETTPASDLPGDTQPATPGQPAQTPHIEQAFVGTNQCFTCHRAQANDWSETNHAQAHNHLPEKYRNDAACLKCHVTAFAKPTGYVAGTEKDLLMVGCESCHGPGALHIDAAQRFLLATAADEARIEQEIRETIVKTPTDAVCVTCHTTQAHGSHPHYEDTLPAQPPSGSISQSNRPTSATAHMASATAQTRYIPGYSVKTCGSCHYDQYLMWRTEKHSALAAALPAKHIADESCRACHVDAGFPGGLVSNQLDPARVGVACESCHGPALEHVRFNVRFIHAPTLGPKLEQAARDSIRRGRPASTCVQCHVGQSHKEHPQIERD